MKIPKYFKFIASFFGVIIAIFILYISGVLGWQKYRYWQDEKIAQKAEEGIRKWQQEDYERAMADTYGGKTPQETLQMYIDAVGKGDYELASKYFIGSRQEEEKEQLFKTDENNNIKFLLDLLKKINKSGGYFSSNQNRYTIEKPFFVELKLYPNNIWKIIEI